MLAADALDALFRGAGSASVAAIAIAMVKRVRSFMIVIEFKEWQELVHSI